MEDTLLMSMDNILKFVLPGILFLAEIDFIGVSLVGSILL
jgi:hypothetical protein